MNQYSDPIYKLLNDIQYFKKPSDAWLEEWSKNGRDPIAAAWEASTSVEDMLAFLRWLKIKLSLKEEGDRHLNASRTELEIGPNKVLSYETESDGFSDPVETVLEYNIDDKGRRVGEWTKKSTEDFVNALRKKTKDQVTQELFNKILAKFNSARLDQNP